MGENSIKGLINWLIFGIGVRCNDIVRNRNHFCNFYSILNRILNHIISFKENF